MNIGHQKSLEIDLNVISKVLPFPTSTKATILNVAIFLKSEFSERMMIKMIGKISWKKMIIIIITIMILIRADVQTVSFNDCKHDN